MNICKAVSESDFNAIRILWSEVFGNEHPMVVNKELMKWFYEPVIYPLSSGFVYSKINNSKPNAFIGYKTVQWSDIEEVWLCGLGANKSTPGAGLFLLRNFLKIYSQKTLCVVGFIPELTTIYSSLGFVIEKGFRNLAKVVNTSGSCLLFDILTAKEFFSNYSEVIRPSFINSYRGLLRDHIVWEYFVFVRHSIAFFVRKETDLICRVVMAYDMNDGKFEKLTGYLTDELYCSIGKNFNCEYIDFVSNINLELGSNRSDIFPLEDCEFPGYFSPQASYRPLNFAVKSSDSSKRSIYFKADGDQERSNGC